MYPDLSYLLHDLFGTQPDNWASIFKTFGLLMVISILVGAWLLFLELKRRQEAGLLTGTKVKIVEGLPAQPSELIWNGLIGFVVGYKLLYLIQNMADFQANPSAVLISREGSWIGGLIGLAAFAGYRYWEKNRKKLAKPVERVEMVYPHDRIGDITVVAALSGIVGAKIFALIEDLESFFQDPIGQFFSGSGLAIYGGLIGGFLGVSWYLRKHKIPFWQVADAVAPALMIAYGIGRIGCQLSGDGDWGIVAGPQPGWWFLPDWMWSYTYPNNVAKDGIPIPDCTFLYCTVLEKGVYPTPFYETVMAFLIGGFLWLMRNRTGKVGNLFFLYLILNGVERFFIEIIRINDTYPFLGFELSQAQIIALGLMAAGIGGFIWNARKK